MAETGLTPVVGAVAEELGDNSPHSAHSPYSTKTVFGAIGENGAERRVCGEKDTTKDTGRLRYGELFAGAGGLSLGLDRAGLTCAFHAELGAAPRSVLFHRWPDVPLYGDVAALDGRALVRECGPIDLLSGGSPCQDLSVAGKRAGLVGARSGLFHEQMRLWDETGADLCLWENVLGAMSSNRGRDFGAVLSAFVGAAVPVPSDGWGSAGVVAGPSGVAAWRVLDAQWFGVPQRRARVFVLGTRAGSLDPAQVLLEPEGVRWHPAPRRETGEGAAERVGAGAALAVNNDSRAESGSVTAPLRGGARAQSAVLAFHHTQDPISGPVAPSLVQPSDGMGVLAWNEPISPTGHQGDTFVPLHGPARCLPASGGNNGGGPGQLVVTIGGEVAHALTHEGHDASEDGTGRGVPIVARCDTTGEGGRLDSETCTFPIEAGIPRRLTPRECERLMGWPDDWTLVPMVAGMVDGRRRAEGRLLSDAARYKACGNGVVSHVAQWIGERIVAARACARSEAAA